MKTFSKILLAGTLSALAFNFSAYGAPLSEKIENYAEKIPGIGLISDSIEFDGITINDFRFDNNKRFIFVEPGEEFVAHFNYTIDASQLKTLHLHHLIIGLYDDGPQKCVLHSLGIKDSKGTATISLKAPNTAGAYQVRFCHSEKLTEHQALDAWWRGDGPSAKTIVGIVVVK